MFRKVIEDLWLCEDCTLVAVNGDASGVESDKRVREIEAGLLKLGPHLVPDFDSETGDGMNEFSSWDCDCCGSPLAGAMRRFAVLEECEGCCDA